MKDSVFYPLIAVLVVGMIASSLLTGWGTPQCGPFGGADGPEDYSLITLKGSDLCRMQSHDGYELDLKSDVLTIRAEADAIDIDVLNSAHFPIGPDIEAVFTGHKVRISLTVKPSSTSGAEAFEFNYSAGVPGNTGWVRFDLEEDWETYTAEVNIPYKTIQNTAGLDFISVRPVVPEGSRSIELREIRFRRLGQW